MTKFFEVKTASNLELSEYERRQTHFHERPIQYLYIYVLARISASYFQYRWQ